MSSDSTQDPLTTLVPEGKYEMTFVGEDRCRIFGRLNWETIWEIQEGPHRGERLKCWWTIPEKGEQIRPLHGLSIAFTQATGLRPPQHLRTIRPSEWLSDCVFEVHVRTVRKDSKGVQRADAANYSRVNHITRTVAGSSPFLRKRRRNGPPEVG